MIDEKKLNYVGSIWMVDLTPSSLDSVETDEGLFLNKICISDKQKITTENNVSDLGKQKTFPVNGELCGRIQNLIGEYSGKLSIAETVGVLEMIKIGLLTKGGNDESM